MPKKKIPIESLADDHPSVSPVRVFDKWNLKRKRKSNEENLGTTEF